MEDWFHQMSNPRKIKNSLTYFTYLLTYLYTQYIKKRNTYIFADNLSNF